MVHFDNDWQDLLQEEFTKDYYLRLRSFLKDEYKTKTIYPKMDDIYSAFRYTAYKDAKVVILGQDPYHGKGQANGLSFSVQKGIAIPPSLLNIYKELQTEYGIAMPPHGDLTDWTKQGVLLLNTCMTVREGMANSHKGMGWETFTDRVIALLNERETPMVFLLWGANAKSKAALITNPKHLILTAVHPSPLSAHGGFFGCGHFQKANAFLEQQHMTPIDWDINHELEHTYGLS